MGKFIYALTIRGSMPEPTTYFAKIEKTEEGWMGYIPVAGLEKVRSSGKKTKEDCYWDLHLRLNLDIHIGREQRKAIPKPNEYAEGLEAIAINIQRNALVVQAEGMFQNYLQELLSKQGYEATFTNNYDDAVRHLRKRVFDVVIIGSPYGEKEEYSGKDNGTRPGFFHRKWQFLFGKKAEGTLMWKSLHKEVRTYGPPDVDFILYTAANPSDVEESMKPKVTHVLIGVEESKLEKLLN